MTRDSLPLLAHPPGERPLVVESETPPGVVVGFQGTVRVEWDREAATAPLGQPPFVIDSLRTAGLFNAFVADCPFRYTSPNAPRKRDVLGTAMLAGARRNAHIAGVRGDAALPELLGMTKVVSEDSIRRDFWRPNRLTSRGVTTSSV
jgi:hypothetical protein